MDKFLSLILRYTYLPKFFHRAKNDSPFISVGSKNLFIVNGNLTNSFCGELLYIKETATLGVSEEKQKSVK